MGLFSAFQGYISPSYPVTLRDPNTGNAVNLTNATNLTLYLQNRSTLSVVKGSGTWTITSGVNGNATYQWSQADLSVTGLFNAFVTVQLASETSPRAFQPDEILILSFPGVAIVATQDVNLLQVNGSALSTSNPVPASSADGANIALGATTSAAYTGSGSSTAIGLLKGAYTVLASMLAKLSILVSTAGYVAAAAGAPTATVANTDTAYTFASVVNRWLIQNNSAVSIQFELDATATAGSIILPAGQAYTDASLPITAVHLYAASVIQINGSAAGNIVIRGWT